MKANPGFVSTIICGVLLLTGCSKTDKDNPALKQQITQDLAYGTHAQQRMDVYLPANRTTNTPLIIFLHGGGFVAGDKSDVSTVAQYYLDLGYAVANANYRLVDSSGLLQTPVLHQLSAVKISDQLADIQLIVNALSAQAQGWMISADKWILAGHSAGATLSLLYAHGAANGSGKIKAAANFAGATTFAYNDESEAALLDPLIREVLYRATGKEATNANKLYYMAISPYWVSNNTTNGVPVINIRPSKDAGDNLYQAYAQMLNGKSIVNQYVVIEGAGHGFDPDGKWQEAITKSDVFFKTYVW